MWFGPLAQYAGGVLLVVLGGYQFWQAGQATGRSGHTAAAPWSLFLLAFGVSLDTLVAGVAFGFRGEPIQASATLVGAVTAVLTLIGLELGASAGRWRPLAARVAPAVLVGVGLAIAARVP